MAAGVGPWDAWIRAGRSVVPQPLPLTLGSDISGVVVAAGPEVAEFRPGDTVFGVTNQRFTGGYAEFALAAAGMLALSPARMDPSRGRFPPRGFSHRATGDRMGRGRDRADGRHHGGADSVGSIAVQLAHRAGARVIVTAGSRDLAYVRGLGADQVLDYRAGPFEDAIRDRVDAVLDFVGGETQSRSFSVLRPGGRLVSAVSEPDQRLAIDQGVTAAFILVKVTAERLASVAALFAAGAVAADIGAVLPLASARVAHEMLDGARLRPRGQIILRVAP